MNKILLVTGSNGLIGSEMVGHFHRLGWKVHGIDNNMRAEFFGPQGDTRWNQKRLLDKYPGYVHHEVDVRDREGMKTFVAEGPADCGDPHRGPAEPRPRRPACRSTTSTSTPAAR